VATTTATETWSLKGHSVRVSHLDKVLWPEEGITKEDVLNYYRSIAPLMLPYLKDRPVTLRVFPKGIQGFSHYRRDLPAKAPGWLRSVDYWAEGSATATQLPLIDDAAGLLWLANQGGLEFHIWSARSPNLNTPDLVIFDLDPGDKATFSMVREAACLLRETLEAVGLQGYLKTSGGRGLHVFLPLIPEYTFEAVHTWTKALAEKLASTQPDLFALPQSGTHRGQRVTLDYAQNSLARNTAAPFTLRGRPGAPISTPLTWEELEAGDVEPADLTLRTVPARVRQTEDPFRPVLGKGQRLP
jgi:bifunctional non-homologous end joining protein LigD